MQLNKIEERRAKKVTKLEGSDDDGDGQASDEDGARVKNKKLKNMKKMMDYHSRKRREFKQREPIQMEES